MWWLLLLLLSLSSVSGAFVIEDDGWSVTAHHEFPVWFLEGMMAVIISLLLLLGQLRVIIVYERLLLSNEVRGIL